MIGLFALALATILDIESRAPQVAPWIAARGFVDVDGDGVPDEVRIESPHPKFVVDPDPCASCGDRVEGMFVAIVELSKHGRTVSSPVYLHNQHEALWFWRKPAARLHIANYASEGIADFNLGQFASSTKWEYGLFSIAADGRIHRFATDKPEIYVSPGDEPSTDQIVAIPGGMRFQDFGNAGEHAGWWVSTCLWKQAIAGFSCASLPQVRQ